MAACIAPVTLWRPMVWTPGRYHSDVVPCGKCPECIKRRAAQWYFRLDYEKQKSDSCDFITLTYNEENCPELLDKRELQLFWKSLRQYLERPIKYFAVGEYGGETGRPHFHALVYDLEPAATVAILDKGSYRSPILEDVWQKGIVDVRPATVGRLKYVCGYLNGMTGKAAPAFRMMSKKLGADYVTEVRKEFYNRTLPGCLVIEGGEKVSMPRYYQDKLYDEKSRLLLKAKGRRFMEECSDALVDSEDFRMEVERKKNAYLQAQRKRALRPRKN